MGIQARHRQWQGGRGQDALWRAARAARKGRGPRARRARRSQARSARGTSCACATPTRPRVRSGPAQARGPATSAQARPCSAASQARAGATATQAFRQRSAQPRNQVKTPAGAELSSASSSIIAPQRQSCRSAPALLTDPRPRRNTQWSADMTRHGSAWLPRRSLRMSDNLSIVLVVFTISGGFVLIVRALLDYRKSVTLVRAQADAHIKLMERLASSQELLGYMETDAGKKFLQLVAVGAEQL